MKKYLILSVLLISVNLNAKMLTPKELGIDYKKQNYFSSKDVFVYINTNMIVGLSEEIDGCKINMSYTYNDVKSVKTCKELAKIINK